MNKKEILCWLAAFAVMGAVYVHEGQRAAELEKELAAVRGEIQALEVSQGVLANDLVFKTHPATIDSSLRAWFEEEINNGPQVRGVDGKLPQERQAYK